jgi:hypothetical protein
MKHPKYITIAYEVRDWQEFQKINPLQLEHNGLEAVMVSCGYGLEPDDVEMVEAEEA